ncbi:MAG: helix-turn-helix domain-containing protein [Synergistales bacterium]|nr:helix-turn-helix domain-containing protein [Synergistales bacterium]
MLEKYAQEMADSTSRIIGHHVHITDKDGLVIGTSKPERLGHVLFEVPQVVRSRKGCLISEEEAQKLPDTLAGATYPIYGLDGQIAGAICILGDPEKVNCFALIVQKQAEMYLREMAFQENALYQERTIQALLKDILAFDPRIAPAEPLLRKATEFGYEPNRRYVAIFMDYQFSSTDIPDRNKPVLHSRTLSIVRSIFQGKNDMSAGIRENAILIFHALGEERIETETEMKALSEKCGGLQGQLKNHDISASFGIGSPVSDLGGCKTSYTEARGVLERGRIFYPSRTIFSIWENRFHELIASTGEIPRIAFVADRLASLNSQKDSMELKETIQSWCQNNFSVQDTARVLHIHRNTLYYRIHKIENLYDCSMRNFTRMMELYLALNLEKIELSRSSM